MIRYPKYPMVARARMIKIMMVSFFIVYPSSDRCLGGRGNN
jgi:hypothetical protein